MEKDFPRIIGVGHCCQDSICTVEEYPAEDSSTHITAIDDSQGGGAVATALVAAERLGVHTGMIANLGDDAVGGRIVQELTRLGVSTEGIRQIAGGRSSSSIVMVDPRKGTRTKFPYKDNLPEIAFDERQRTLLRHAQVLHLDGTNYQNAWTAAKLAKEYGVLISLDGCSMQKENEKNRRLAAMADILIMNAKYPYRVSGEETLPEAMANMASLGARVVVSTAGGDGCYAWEAGRLTHYPAYQTEVRDTTGAGDVFHGAFLTAYLEGRSPGECIRFASAVATLKCRRLGGRAGIPAKEEAELFMREAGQPSCG